MNMVTGSALMISAMSDRSYTSNDVSTLARNLKDSMSENKEYTLVQNVKQNTLNGQKYSYFVFSRKTDYGTGYVTIVLAEKNGDLINITYTEEEIYHKSDGNELIEHIIETLQ